MQNAGVALNLWSAQPGESQGGHVVPLHRDPGVRNKRRQQIKALFGEINSPIEEPGPIMITIYTGESWRKMITAAYDFTTER